jgi:hypothetical protein
MKKVFIKRIAKKGIVVESLDKYWLRRALCMGVVLGSLVGVSAGCKQRGR